MQPRGRLGRPRQPGQPRADPLDHRRLAGVHRARVDRTAQIRQYAVLGVPGRPVVAGDVAHRGEPDERLHRTARRRRPERGRAAARRPASSRPNRSAASRPGRPSRTRSSTSHASSRPCTRGTGVASASASQRSPAASARAASASSARFTITVRPSSRAASASEPDSGRSPVTARPVSRAATAPGVSSPDAGDDRGIGGLLGIAVRSAVCGPPSVRALRAPGGRSRGTVKNPRRPMRARHAVGAL